MRAHLGEELGHGLSRVLPCNHPYLALLRRRLPCRAQRHGSAKFEKRWPLVSPGCCRAITHTLRFLRPAPLPRPASWVAKERKELWPMVSPGCCLAMTHTLHFSEASSPAAPRVSNKREEVGHGHARRLPTPSATLRPAPLQCPVMRVRTAGKCRHTSPDHTTWKRDPQHVKVDQSDHRSGHAWLQGVPMTRAFWPAAAASGPKCPATYTSGRALGQEAAGRADDKNVEVVAV